MLIGSSSYFGSSSYYQKPFDFGAEMVKTSLMAARPAFELQFFLTQDAILERLSDDIDNIHNSVNTKGATALIDVQLNRLQNDLTVINDYKARTDAKAGRVEDTLASFSELITLADPSTITEFDAKLARTIDLIETTKTPYYEQYGVQDRLRGRKIDALAQLNALVHNNFATQGDIDAVTATVTAMRTDYLASQTIINSNVKIAYTLKKNGSNAIQELTRQASSIKTEALSDATSKVKDKQAYYSQLLTAISLSFETSLAIAQFLAENLVLPKKTEPGSLINLFT